MTDYISKHDLDDLAAKLIKHINKQTKDIKNEIKAVDKKYEKLITIQLDSQQNIYSCG